MTILSFDRDATTRKNAGALEQLLQDESTRFVPLWRNRVVVLDASPALLSPQEASDILARSAAPVYLGRSNDRAIFGLDVDPSSQLQPLLDDAAEIVDLRIIGAALKPGELEMLSLARAIMLWQRNNRYCGRCAGPMQPQEGGHMLRCEQCERKSFPRSDPAIMALVVHRGTQRQDDRCFIARQPAFPPGMFSVLAGFVEPGESVEDALQREVLEESGLQAQQIRYLRSQPWPYPASLMLGYLVETDSDQFQLDNDELEEGRWVNRQQLEDPQGFFIPPPYSLANVLLTQFLEGTL